ncbi:MAG: polysaccharide deacetylase family protein [Polyangiaceae bacterium]
MPIARLILVVLVALAYGTTVYAVASGPPPLYWTVPLFVALFTVVNSGVIVLDLGVFLDVVRACRPGRKQIALTFDDGPHPVHTRRVLEMLRAAGAKATFFMVGEKVERHPDVVAEVVRDGHEVGLHSQRHARLLLFWPERVLAEDLQRNQTAIEKACGVKPHLFRPPVGFSSPRLRTVVNQLKLTVIGWTARAYDGVGRPSVEQVVRRLEPRLTDGAIVLLHDACENSDDAPTSLDALGTLLADLRQRGLQAVTVSELMGADAPRASSMVRTAVEPVTAILPK